MSNSQRAMAQRQQREPRKPAFVLRAPDPNNRGRWNTVGYAWERKNGEAGYTIKLNVIPIGSWDGALIALPPLTSDDLPDEES